MDSSSLRGLSRDGVKRSHRRRTREQVTAGKLRWEGPFSVLKASHQTE